MALSEICTEILFVQMIMEFLGQPVEYHIKAHCDNVGAIYLACNKKILRRTKHVDTRTHFVQRYVEEGTIKIVFVRLGEKDTDIFTKNTLESMYNKHTEKFMIQNSS